MTDAPLFNPGPLPPPPPTLSADARRTARNNARIAQGYHPATGLRLAGNGQTCGTCVHLLRLNWRSRRYLKCDRTEMTHGPGTDVRAKWPACTAWEPVTP